MLGKNKTKIVCTIGPASRPPEILEELIKEGMDIARLNFSHGEFAQHKADILSIRRAAEKIGRQVAIMADLPGPKIRIGDFEEKQVILLNGQKLILTSTACMGNSKKISVNLPGLHNTVQEGNLIFVNDGFIQLQVLDVVDEEVICEVIVGGALSSRKGLNIPDVELGVTAFTDKDREIAKFALGIGVDALSMSFVENSKDILSLRKLAHDHGYNPFIIAKIERSRAVENLIDILREADGIMVARGDLGVEIPIAKVPTVQKDIVWKAQLAGKPVITATHMLESMITNRLPTRAEVTDVANAILDGTDCVMLSGESAIGKFPIDAVRTLREIAIEAEASRSECTCNKKFSNHNEGSVIVRDVIASGVKSAIERIETTAIIVPTRSGMTARNISRYRLPVWIIAVTSQKETAQDLIFSYGVLPIIEPDHPGDWKKWIAEQFRQLEISGGMVILTEGPSAKYPDRNNRMEIIDLIPK